MAKRSQRPAPRTQETNAPAVQAESVPAGAVSDTPQAQAQAQAEAQAEAGANDRVAMLVGNTAIWDDQGVRREPGEVVHLPADIAKKLNKDGKAQAYNPLLQD